MSYVIMNQVTQNLYRPSYSPATYDTMRGAKGMATRLNKATVSGKPEWVAMSYDEFNTNYNPIVTVFSLMNGRPVQIRRSEVGGCTDPSTERYWAM